MSQLPKQKVRIDLRNVAPGFLSGYCILTSEFLFTIKT